MSRTSMVEPEVTDYRSINRKSYSYLASYDKDRIDFFMTHVLKDEAYLEAKKKKDEKKEGLKYGSLVDILLTDPDSYEKLYYESTLTSFPAPQMMTFCDNLYEITSKEDCKFSDCALKAYEKTKEDNGGKIGAGFPKFMENFEDPKKNAKAYYNELVTSNGRTVISVEEHTKAMKTVDKIKYCDAFRQEGEVFTKFPILFDYGQHEMKAEIDEMRINHGDKVIFPFDYKKSSFVESFIFDSFLKYRYYLQSSLYKFAVQQWALKEFPTYKVENLAFKVYDTSGVYDPLLYKTSDVMFEQGFTGFYVGKKWYKGIDQILEEIEESEKMNNWGISVQNYKNNGIVWIPDFNQEIE